MKLVVAGGTGWVGRRVVEAGRASGHTVTVISRSTGIDLRGGGDGLAQALAGVDAVIDVTDSGSVRRSTSRAFVDAATGNLLAAGTAAGVQHHVALSIAGIDRVLFGYYQAKLHQEDLIAAGSVPWTILRASQFHEFPAQLFARTKGPLVPVPRMRSSTVAAADVAARLLDLVAAAPAGLVPEFGGPETHEMPDLARRWVRARRLRRRVLPVRLPGRTGAGMAGGDLVAAGSGPSGSTTFDAWLAAYTDD